MKTPALVGPNDEITYHDPAVQQVICEIFGYLMPAVVEADGVSTYTCPDGSGNDLCSQTEPVNEITDIPKPELAQLMGAWFAIRRLGNDSKLDTRIRAILRNFRFPDPMRALDLYRLSTDASGTVRLHLWWGIEPIEGRNPTTDGATAFSKLLNCKVSDVEERWKSYSRQTSKQLVMPGNNTSQVVIDPVTKAVRVLSQTGAVPIDPATGEVYLGQTEAVNAQANQGLGAKLSNLDPIYLMLGIVGIGAVILVLIFVF